MNIGARKVIARERIIIPDGEPAKFSVDHNGTKLQFIVEFKAGAEPLCQPGLTWENSNGEIRIRFVTLSTTPLLIMKPSQLGTFDDGSKLLLLAEYYRYASIGVISLQLMVEEANG